jgi:hypothetical protein
MSIAATVVSCANPGGSNPGSTHHRTAPGGGVGRFGVAARGGAEGVPTPGVPEWDRWSQGSRLRLSTLDRWSRGSPLLVTDDSTGGGAGAPVVKEEPRPEPGSTTARAGCPGMGHLVSGQPLYTARVTRTARTARTPQSRSPGLPDSPGGGAGAVVVGTETRAGGVGATHFTRGANWAADPSRHNPKSRSQPPDTYTNHTRPADSSSLFLMVEFG